MSISRAFDLIWRCVNRRSAGAALAAEGGLAAVALDVHLDDRGVVDETVDGREGHGLIGEDAAPLAERLIGRDEQRAPLVAGARTARWSRPDPSTRR